MTPTVLLVSLGIALARVVDVSIGTLRMIHVVRGRKAIAAALGFVEVLIWITVISRVVRDLDQPSYMVSYALGFALGTYVGMAIEERMTGPAQVVRIFTRRAREVVSGLRELGFVVTEFEGAGRGGPIGMLFLETARKRVGQVLDEAGTLDEECFCIVDDIGLSASGARIRSGTVRGPGPVRAGK